MNFATALVLALIVVLIYRATYQGRSWTIVKATGRSGYRNSELSGGAPDARALANISASHGKYRSASSGSPVRKN